MGPAGGAGKGEGPLARVPFIKTPRRSQASSRKCQGPDTWGQDKAVWKVENSSMGQRSKLRADTCPLQITNRCARLQQPGERGCGREKRRGGGNSEKAKCLVTIAANCGDTTGDFYFDTHR